MAVNATVSFDAREIRSKNKDIQKAARFAAKEALNTTASDSRKRTIKLVQRKINVKKGKKDFVKNRYKRDGRRRGDRATIKKARANYLEAAIEVYMRGVPAYQLSNKATKAAKQRARKVGGIKLKDGRFYEGAFYHKGLILKRRGDARKAKLMLPKIGLREALDEAYRRVLLSRRAQREFIKRYNSALRFKLSQVKTNK